MEKVLELIEKEKSRYLDQLFEFLKIPSISSSAAHKEDMAKCAVWLSEHMKKIGIEDTRIIKTPGHPIVYGEWTGAGENAKTVLIYGHYDVQPVDPIEEWDNPPFQPEIREGKILARGSADDKGQLFTHLKAVGAYFKTHGKLPVNVKFLVEGEEEASESNLDEFIQENADMLACDTVLISDTEWFAEGLPSICYGLRGIAFGEITVRGPKRDLHSGSFGGAVDNPIEVLANMIAQLKDEDRKVTIPGFYDDVLELGKNEKKELNKLPHSDKKYKEDLNVNALNGEKDFTTLERVWARPTLELNGIWGGYTGEGSKTIIPSKASAKFSMRLVPHQKASDIAKKFEKYIREIAPPTVTVEVKVAAGGNPILVERDSAPVKAAIKALKTAFKKEVVFMREGGSIPIVETFDSVLKIPTVLLGLGLPTDNIHSPNENFGVENFFGGIKASAIFFDEYSKMKD